MRIERLVIEPDREDHIARHGVSAAEVNQLAFGTPLVRRTKKERYRLTGQTEGGRYLTVIIAPRSPGAYGLVTARDATEPERREYRARRRR